MLKVAFRLLCVLALFGCKPAGRNCTARGCSSGLVLLVDSPVPAEALTGLQVEYCHGATLPSLSAGSEHLASVILTNELRRPFAFVRIIGRNNGRPYFMFQSNLATDSARPGDVYRATIFGAAEKVLFTTTEKVEQYQMYYPNGPDCGGGCRSATIDRRAVARF